jgi:hypothetical protein
MPFEAKRADAVDLKEKDDSRSLFIHNSLAIPE